MPNNEVCHAVEEGVPEPRAAESCPLVQNLSLDGEADGSSTSRSKRRPQSATSSLRADAIDNAFKSRTVGSKAEFEDGDKVEVWSKSKRIWLLGHVANVAGPEGYDSMPAGSVKVEYANLQKWIAPKDFNSTIRHYVPCEASRDPKALPPHLLQTIRLRFYIEAGAGGRPSWAARTLLRAHELAELWVSAEEAVSRCTVTDQEKEGIISKVDALFAEIGAQHGRDPEPAVDVHEFTHHVLLLAHPPGPVALEALRGKLTEPGPGARLPQLVSRWMELDAGGLGLVSFKAFAQVLQKELRVTRPDAERKALAMLRGLSAEGVGQASYGEFVACCLGLRYQEVNLCWYDLSNDWAKVLSPLLGSREGGLWHTGISVFGREYFLDGGRIAWSTCGAAVWGRPARIQRLGITTKTLDELREHVFMELDPQFDQQSYDVLDHNCNHFTDKVAQFLLGIGIPDEIRLQPQRLMSAPGAWMIRPLVDDWLEQDVRYQRGAFPIATKLEALAHERGLVASLADAGDDSTSAGTRSDEDAKAAPSSDSASSGGASDSEAERGRDLDLLPMTTMSVKVNGPRLADVELFPRAHRKVAVHVAS